MLFFWVLEQHGWARRTCIAVPRPALHLANGGSPDQTASRSRGAPGTSYWFWEGLHVPTRVAASSSYAGSCSTRIGYERFLDIAGSDLVAQDDFGKLWRSELRIDDEPLHVVEVVNSTPEPDGTHRRYFLRVPPKAARPARQWPGRSASTTHATTCSPPKADGAR